MNKELLSSGKVLGVDEPLTMGVFLLTAANGGLAPVLPVGPAADENENARLL